MYSRSPFLFVFVGILYILWPAEVYALKISEVFYDAIGSDEGKEWLELWNDEDQPVLLTDYTIEDRTRHKISIPTDQSGHLDPGQYAIVARDLYRLELPHSDRPKIIAQAAISLPNYQAGKDVIGHIALSRGETIIDRVNYHPTIAGAYGYSLELADGLLSSQSDYPGGTPGRARPHNRPPPPVIKINEIVSNPEGTDDGQEWIELVNRGHESIRLDGWQISDGPTDSGRRQRQKLDGLTIDTAQVLQVKLKGSMLNNSGDTVELINLAGQTVDRVEIPLLEEGSSWAWFDNSWRPTSQPTSGETNIIAQPSVSSQLPAASTKVARPNSGSASNRPGNRSSAAIKLSPSADNRPASVAPDTSPMTVTSMGRASPARRLSPARQSRAELTKSRASPTSASSDESSKTLAIQSPNATDYRQYYLIIMAAALLPTVHLLQRIFQRRLNQRQRQSYIVDSAVTAERFVDQKRLW